MPAIPTQWYLPTPFGDLCVLTAMPEPVHTPGELPTPHANVETACALVRYDAASRDST